MYEVLMSGTRGNSSSNIHNRIKEDPKPGRHAKQRLRHNSFHMRCMRSVLGVTRQDRITNEGVLEKAQPPSFTALLKQSHLRWLLRVQREVLGNLCFALKTAST
ncbi:unnamed protein product [Parnassius apollo]|uniref:(apollo) hypothetical protein n=1 Tax=Parnassius apollo TaxID=110799 RepID=A0A8S3XP56_PARAO|nr:unnamed protein product [Parnassius apollo]